MYSNDLTNAWEHSKAQNNMLLFALNEHSLRKLSTLLVNELELEFISRNHWVPLLTSVESRALAKSTQGLCGTLCATKR